MTCTFLYMSYNWGQGKCTLGLVLLVPECHLFINLSIQIFVYYLIHACSHSLNGYLLSADSVKRTVVGGGY